MDGSRALARLGRRALGTALGVLVRAWMATLRVTVTGEGACHFFSRGEGSRCVLAFAHGQQLGLHAVRRGRDTAVIVSRSTDGDIQTAALSVLSLRVVRGSSSRGGARALSAVTRALRLGADAAFAIDGPRGPAGVPKPGAALAAIKADALLLPVATASSRAVVLRRAWDRFEIPLPFSRLAVVVGAPIGHGDAASMTAALQRALRDARDDAERFVKPGPAEVLKDCSWRSELR
jgi:lysophospholipid acyltransferase (LPLAT)-like uncharacterized protein